MFGNLFTLFSYGFLISNSPRTSCHIKTRLPYIPNSAYEHGVEHNHIIKDLFSNKTLPSLNHTTKQEAFVRCTYSASVDELSKSSQQIPKEFHKLLAKDSEHTETLAKKFHEARRNIGHYYKNKTAEIHPVTIREIEIRNLMRYRDELGPTYESLKNGIGTHKDDETKKKLTQKYGLKDSDIKFHYTNKTKTDLEIIESSCRTDGSDFAKPQDYQDFVTTCKPKVRLFPLKVADFLGHLKDAVYTYATNHTLHEIANNHSNKESGFLSRLVDGRFNESRALN